MSKNITIQEGGLAKQLTVDKLKTNLVGGGSCLWVPEDGTNLGTKHISENGTFRASDDGYYGYSEVTVSGVGSVTGRDPDTGEEKQVTVDPQTGDIVETVIPTEIRITTLPTKTTYENGETIDYSGIVVRAYSATGQDMGAVPFSELVFPATTAEKAKSEYTDGSGLNAMMLYLTPKPYVNWRKEESISYVGQEIGSIGGEPASYGNPTSPGTILLTKYNGTNYGFWVTGGYGITIYSYTEDEDHDEKSFGWRASGGDVRVITSDKFASFPFSDYLNNIPISTVNPTTVDPTDLHAMQNVPVQWNRTGDGKALETSFKITVA